MADTQNDFQVGDIVDVEWMRGQFWRDGIITSLRGAHASISLPTGWHVYPEISSLRKRSSN